MVVVPAAVVVVSPIAWSAGCSSSFDPSASVVVVAGIVVVVVAGIVVVVVTGIVGGGGAGVVGGIVVVVSWTGCRTRTNG